MYTPIAYLSYSFSSRIMAIPSIDFSELDGDKRSKTMATLHEACEKWGFFQVLTVI